MCRVVNKRKEAFDVYIGRGSKWGNPYPISREFPRPVVIAAYRQLLWKKIQNGDITIEDLLALDGKRLGCFCKPQACHGDVIARAVQWAKASQVVLQG